MHEPKPYTGNQLKSSNIFMLIRIIVVLSILVLASSCSPNEIPKNYIATSICDGITAVNNLGIPIASGDYQKIYIYKDKTYILVHYQKVDGEESFITNDRVSIKNWEELFPVLGERIIMEQGDIATLSKEQFIRYMEALYP